MLVQKLFKDKISSTAGDVKDVAEMFGDSSRLKQLESMKEFQAVMQNEKIKDLLDDEQTMKQIRNRDFAKLLTNSKMQNILDDPELIKKMLEFNQRMAEESIKPKEKTADHETVGE